MNAERILEVYGKISEAPDAIQKLRRFVLDLAIRGKLVEQNPADEPADRLLAAIASEKASLIKEGVLKAGRTPKKAATPVELFDLPQGWAWTDLQSVCLSVTDGDHQPPPRADEGVPFLVIGDVRTKAINYDVERKVPREYYDGLDPIRKPQSGDLLYTLVGSFGIPIPVLKSEQFCVQRHIGILKPAKQFNLSALALFLESEFAFKQAAGAATGIAQKTVSLAGLRAMILPAPPLAEQHRIVAKVGEFMTLFDQLEEARKTREKTRGKLTAASLARLTAPETSTEEFPAHAQFALDALPSITSRPDQIKTLRQTILNLAVRGKLLPQRQKERVDATIDRTEPEIERGEFPLPGNWTWTDVRSVATSRLGKMLDKGKNRGTPRPYLRNVNVRWFDFQLDDLFEMPFEDRELDEFRLEQGDVLICEGGEPGRAAVWDGAADGVYFQKALHRVRFHAEIDPTYFTWGMKASADDGRLALYFTGAGIKHFTGKNLAAYRFPLPPLAEQHRIVAKIDALMALCDRLEAALTIADTNRVRLLEALLHEALEPTSDTLEAAE